MISFSLFFMDIYFKVWSLLHIRTRHLCFVKFYDIIKKCWDLNFSCWKSSCFLANAEAMCSEVIFFKKSPASLLFCFARKKHLQIASAFFNEINPFRICEMCCAREIHLLCVKYSLCECGFISFHRKLLVFYFTISIEMISHQRSWYFTKN